MIVWVIGMSGAGKTAIGTEVHRQWKATGAPVVMVDGDQVRRIVGQDQSDADYTLVARRENAERLFEICRWLDLEGINVVCSHLSLFADLRDRNRETFSSYFEVFVDVPIDVLVERDDKGIYQAARRGETANVVGVDIDFPRPERADLVVENGGFDVPLSRWAGDILRAVGIVA